MKRLHFVLVVLATNLLLAAPAWAGDNGEGLLGETNDRDVTFFALGVVAFFTFVVCFGSWAQNALEKRKEAKKASDLKQRVGW
jgi:hypothetical protein